MSVQQSANGAGSAPAADALASLLDGVLAVPLPVRLEGLQVGRLVGWDEGGQPQVELPGAAPGPRPARTTVALRRGDVGRAVAVLCEGGRAERPVIVGLLQPPGPAPEEPVARGSEVTLDGRRVELSAEREIVLRCGEASITLTRAGKVLIKGAYVCSRSSGQNDVKGATVHVN